MVKQKVRGLGEEMKWGEKGVQGKELWDPEESGS